MQTDFLSLDKETQKQIVETLIFASELPLSLENIIDIIDKKLDFTSFKTKKSNNAIEEISNFEEYLTSLIEEINSDLEITNRPYQIIQVANGYTFATKKEFGKILGSLPQFKHKKRFSKAMLETLAIIAYKQPITRPEIEEIRGTNTSEILNTLLERNLIKIVGRKETIGRPFMYGVTIEFLKTFGLNNLSELPNLEEIRTLIEAKSKQQELTLKIDFGEEQDQSFTG
ncbi:MAG: Segregation and condensation protein B [Candidatus Kapaibacterium sp.]|nr:MAG: Segregation and condensation protein B [Candidatus Kapabacteria bacterium]